ncbi:putative RING zinc finger and ankyrin repeat containing protein [Iris pallida]|uniref:RING zinc finger and ankyrin repeat containing protein n=1 Tax=Iris pallida TaxID=29817 RepID=A0AAX6FYC2_IRIPA|nr:putative RING zinc finger and ankyrin repeat containing protein [Iris pallida]
MGAHHSKEELVYQQVNYGNVEGIKALRRDGAGLEWIDKEGKTPLILACMRPDLLPVAKVLIELGANVNAYRPGCHAGTPLHHAAKRGLDQTVNLLISHGANPLVMNDDCQTPLDLARAKGHCNVVRAIEARICLFSGWLREIFGPSILEAFAPQWVSRKIWAVVLPCDSRNPMNPRKFDLAIYPDLQVAQPRVVIALWKAHIDDHKFNQIDPTLVIVDKATKTKYKFLSAYEGDKQQLQLFYNACRGIIQQNSSVPVAPVGSTSVPTPMSSRPYLGVHASSTSTAAPPVTEDAQLAMAINASIQTARAEGIPITGTTDTNTNGWGTPSENTSHNGWGLPDRTPPPKVGPSLDPYNGWSGVRPNSSSPQLHTSQPEAATARPSAQGAPLSVSIPSAPPIVEETFYAGPIHYPSIESSPINLTIPASESKPGTGETKEVCSSTSSSSCVICLDAPVEGACIPCGHMAGCMSCLNEIKTKRWGCPVCRAEIDQVVRLYAV